MEIKNRITGEILDITEKNIRSEIYKGKIFKYFKLDIEFLDRFSKYFRGTDWSSISTYQILSKEIIKKYYKHFSIDCICEYQKIDEDLIKYFQNNEIGINWKTISVYQNLSEDFIEEYKFLLDWFNISRYQTLSFKFIEKYKNKLDLSAVNLNINANNLFEKEDNRTKEKIKKEKFLNLIFSDIKSSNIFIIDQNKDYFLTCFTLGVTTIDGTDIDYYINNNLIKKLEIGKEICSDNGISNFIVGSRGFLSHNHYLAKVYYKDLTNYFESAKITPITRFNKGWRFKL